MRIAIFSDTYAPEINGVARTLKRYTDYLEERGIEYRLFIPDYREPLPSVPNVQRFLSVPLMFYPECRIALPNPVRIKESLEDFQPTLIHVATPFNLGLYGHHYGKKLGIPMVASYHTHFDDYLDYYKLSIFKKMSWKYIQWFHRPFAKIYAPSESTKQKLILEKVHSDVEIWGRGIDHTFFNPIKRSSKIREKYDIREENIVLYVGRLAPEKDVQTVMNTYHALPSSLLEKTHFLIVGDGPLLKSLADMCNPNMTFTGFQEGEDLAEIYASSDVFLFPSPTETFGNVVLEAMSSGLPVVGARAGGVQHLIDPHKNGYLCESQNVEEFVKSVSILLENKELRQQFGKQARSFASAQSWETIFDNLLQSFKEIKEDKEKRYTA